MWEWRDVLPEPQFDRRGLARRVNTWPLSAGSASYVRIGRAASARHRRAALSRIAWNMGCKSCGEPAIARSTSEIADRWSISSASCSCNSEREEIGLRAVLAARRVFSWLRSRFIATRPVSLAHRSRPLHVEDRHHNGSGQSAIVRRGSAAVRKRRISGGWLDPPAD